MFFIYGWASLVAQMVKNPPAVQKTWVWSLGWEDLPEEGMAAHSSILAWRIPMDRVESIECFWFMVTIFFKYVNPLLFLLL